MSLIPSFIRYREVTTALDSDSLFLQPIDSDIPKKIDLGTFKSIADDLDNNIMYGGNNSIDEDVYKLIGGLGTSINSDIYNL